MNATFLLLMLPKILGLAEQFGLNLPLAEATKKQYDQMIELGKGELDKSGVAELTFPDRS